MIADTLRRLELGEDKTVVAVPHKTSPYLTFLELSSGGELSYIDDYTLPAAGRSATFSNDGNYLVAGYTGGIKSFTHNNGAVSLVDTVSFSSYICDSQCLSYEAEYISYDAIGYRHVSNEYTNGDIGTYNSYHNVSSIANYSLIGHPSINYYFFAEAPGWFSNATLYCEQFDTYTDQDSIVFGDYEYVRVIAVAPDGDYVAVGVMDESDSYGDYIGYVRVYSFNASTREFGSLVASITLENDPVGYYPLYIGGIAFSSDGSQIVVTTAHYRNYNSGYLRGGVHLLDFTGSALSYAGWTFNMLSIPTGVLFSPDGNYIVVSMHNSNISAVSTKFGVEVFGSTPDADDWVYATSYAVGDIVLYSGTFYKCILANSRKFPSSYPAYWEALDVGPLPSIDTSAGIGTDGLAYDYSSSFMQRKIDIYPKPVLSF